jgi:hypothetical protein
VVELREDVRDLHHLTGHYPAEHGHERNCSSDQFGRESVRIAPHRLQKADDPVLAWEILIPEAAHLGHECPRSWMVLAQRECAWLQQRQR